VIFLKLEVGQNYLKKRKVISISYIKKKIVERSLLKRINTLLKKKMILKRNKKYALTTSGQKTVKMIVKIRNIFKLDNLGFYK